MKRRPGPKRIVWEDAVFEEMTWYGVTRSNAQGIADANLQLLDAMYQAGNAPEYTAAALLGTEKRRYAPSV